MLEGGHVLGASGSDDPLSTPNYSSASAGKSAPRPNLWLPMADIHSGDVTIWLAFDDMRDCPNAIEHLGLVTEECSVSYETQPGFVHGTGTGDQRGIHRDDPGFFDGQLTLKATYTGRGSEVECLYEGSTTCARVAETSPVFQGASWLPQFATTVWISRRSSRQEVPSRGVLGRNHIASTYFLELLVWNIGEAWRSARQGVSIHIQPSFCVPQINHPRSRSYASVISSANMLSQLEVRVRSTTEDVSAREGDWDSTRSLHIGPRSSNNPCVKRAGGLSSHLDNFGPKIPFDEPVSINTLTSSLPNPLNNRSSLQLRARWIDSTTDSLFCRCRATSDQQHIAAPSVHGPGSNQPPQLASSGKLSSNMSSTEQQHVVVEERELPEHWRWYDDVERPVFKLPELRRRHLRIQRPSSHEQFLTSARGHRLQWPRCRRHAYG